MVGAYRRSSRILRTTPRNLDKGSPFLRARIFWWANVTGAHTGLEASLGEVLRYARDGVAFFRRAGEVAADPRVRLAFERLAHERQSSLDDLEKSIKNGGLRLAPPPGTGPYPFAAVAKVECYVCGYASEEIPTMCPRCGAARYAFEREFGRAKPWEIAVESARVGVAALEAALKEAEAPLRSTLGAVLERERTLLRESERELAAARA